MANVGARAAGAGPVHEHELHHLLSERWVAASWSRVASSALAARRLSAMWREGEGNVGGRGGGGDAGGGAERGGKVECEAGLAPGGEVEREAGQDCWRRSSRGRR